MSLQSSAMLIENWLIDHYR